MNKPKTVFTAIILAFLSFSLYAAPSFSGYTGAKLNFTTDKEKSDFDPQLKLQAFFAGQFNFTQNIWSHVEVSLDTQNLISESIFHETPANFQIDELSVIFKAQNVLFANYFAAFLGSYDPIGSDVFLQRYFGLEPISSKITESWLGMADSILYPHYGTGIADVVKLHNSPWAAGAYVYYNHEDSKYFVFNSDLRAACNYRYFTCDMSMGIGVPMADKYKGENVIILIDRVYWHAGMNILLGNNYSHSFFAQAGIFNATFNSGSDGMIAKSDDIYLLFEPRLLFSGIHTNVSFFSIPKKTAKNFVFVDDTLGVNLNIYCDNIELKSKVLKAGTHLSFTFEDQYFTDIGKSGLSPEKLNITFTPYVSTDIGAGELHGLLKIKLTDLAKDNPAKAFVLDFGYRGTF